MPKVSICIPCYKHPEDMKQLLETIESQSFTDYEVIITDDTRDDSVKEVVDSFTDMQEKIRYQKNSKQLGHIYNWNEALKMASGEYIKIMFSDDWFTQKDSLQKMVDLLEENPNASLAFSGTRQVMRKSEDITSILSVKERCASDEFLARLKEDYRNLFVGNEIGAPSATMYRACNAYFDEQSNWASDMFLYFDILMDNPEFVCSKEPLISIGEADTQYTYMFEEYDERKYEDYKYMYQKYELEKSETCRKYFLSDFIMPYEKGPVEAKKNHSSVKEYFAEVKKQDGRYKLEMIGNLCFWIGFFLEMVFVVLDKSAYILQYETYDFLFTTFLFGMKIACSRYNLKQWITTFSLGAVGIISYLFTGRLELVRVVIFMAAASKIPLGSQLKTAFNATGIGCLIIVVLSLFGIGYPVKGTGLYRGGGVEETRYSFGMGHPNAFHCMCLMLMILWIAIYFAKSKWYHYVIIFVINIAVYLATDSNYGFMVAIGTMIITLIYRYVKNNSLKNAVTFGGTIVSCLIWIVSMVFGYLGPEVHLLRKIDHYLLNGRIQWGNYYGGPDTWSLLSVEANQEFFDMGWLRVLYWYGFIPTILIAFLIGKMIQTAAKKNKSELLIMIFSLMIYTLFEAHIISVYLGRNYLILLSSSLIVAEIGSGDSKGFLWKIPQLVKNLP